MLSLPYPFFTPTNNTNKLMSNLFTLSITKSYLLHKKKDTEDKSKSLFDQLSTKIQQYAKLSHPSKLFSLSPLKKPQQQKPQPLLSTPTTTTPSTSSLPTKKPSRKKPNHQQQYKTLFLTEEMKDFLTTDKYDTKTYQLDLIDELKIHGTTTAAKLNCRFDYILAGTTIKLGKALDMVSFIKQYDKCMELIEVIKEIMLTAKTDVEKIQERFKEEYREYFEEASFDSLDGEDMQKMVDVYVREIFYHSKKAVSVCQFVGVLLNTEVFAEEKEEVLELLLKISEISPQPSNKSLMRTARLQYNDIMRKIENLDKVEYRVPIQLSKGFMKSLVEVAVEGRRGKRK